MQVKIEITADSADERAVQAVDTVADILAGRAITPAADSSEVRVLEQMAAELETTRAQLDKAVKDSQELAAALTAQGDQLRVTTEEAIEERERAAELEKQLAERDQALGAADMSNQVEELQKDLEARDRRLAVAHEELKKTRSRAKAREQEITRLHGAAEKATAESDKTIDGLRTRVLQLEEQLDAALVEAKEWATWAEDNQLVEYVEEHA